MKEVLTLQAELLEALPDDPNLDISIIRKYDIMPAGCEADKVMMVSYEQWPIEYMVKIAAGTQALWYLTRAYEGGRLMRYVNNSGSSGITYDELERVIDGVKSMLRTLATVERGRKIRGES